jgi:hypothetical protein
MAGESMELVLDDIGVDGGQLDNLVTDWLRVEALERCQTGSALVGPVDVALCEVSGGDEGPLVVLVTGLSALFAGLGLAGLTFSAVLLCFVGLAWRIGRRRQMRVGGVGAQLGFEGLDTGFEQLDTSLLVCDDSGLTQAG